jgi:hypothetical protein
LIARVQPCQQGTAVAVSSGLVLVEHAQKLDVRAAARAGWHPDAYVPAAIEDGQAERIEPACRPVEITHAKDRPGPTRVRASPTHPVLLEGTTKAGNDRAHSCSSN